MAELVDVIRRRRMTRAFDSRPVDDEVLHRLVDLASRAPSAGKSQGWHMVVLTGAETSRFWDVTLPPMRRGSFRWKRLLDAPVIVVVLADPKAYTDRYAEPDKRATGLGTGTEAWPAPYWTIDTSMATMLLLLAAEDAGLGALFFGVFRGEQQLRTELRIPPGLEMIGAVAMGYRADDDPESSQGRSASRRRRSPGEIVHHGRW